MGRIRHHREACVSSDTAQPSSLWGSSRPIQALPGAVLPPPSGNALLTWQSVSVCHQGTDDLVHRVIGVLRPASCATRKGEYGSMETDSCTT